MLVGVRGSRMWAFTTTLTSSAGTRGGEVEAGVLRTGQRDACRSQRAAWCHLLSPGAGRHIGE
eukprot:33070-Eustigmatos_ZCMA.PRE.1